MKGATVNGGTQTYGRKSARQVDVLLRHALSKAEAPHTAKSDFVPNSNLAVVSVYLAQENKSSAGSRKCERTGDGQKMKRNAVHGEQNATASRNAHK